MDSVKRWILNIQFPPRLANLHSTQNTKWFMFTKMDKQKTSLLQSAYVWIYDGSSLPLPQIPYLLYARRTLLFGSIHTPLTQYVIIWWERVSWPRRPEMMWKPIPSLFHTGKPHPLKQERGKSIEEEEGRRRGRKLRMGRLNSRGKKPPLQWWRTTEARCQGGIM